MSQVSYGTITINDITDITDIFLQYCMVADNVTANNITENNWFILSDDTTVEDKYYYVLNDSDGKYYVVTPVGSENPSNLGWYEDNPYPNWQSGYQIWIREVKIKEGINLPEYGTPYLDTAVNQINNDLTAYLDTQGLSAEALNSKLRFMWRNLTPRSQGVDSWIKPNYPAGTYAASGKYNSTLNQYTIDYENSNTYGYNSFLNHNSLNLRYNDVNLTTMSTMGIQINAPVVSNNEISGSIKGVTIDADGMKVYKNINNIDTEVASFGSEIQLGKEKTLKIDKSSITLGDENKFHIYIDGNTQPIEEYTYGLGFYEGPHNPYSETYDTEIVSGKIYYSFNESTGQYEVVSPEPGDNPSEEEWYEKIDKRIAYINNGELSIPYTVVLRGMKLGDKWVWELNKNTDNLTLKWIGGDE